MKHRTETLVYGLPAHVWESLPYLEKLEAMYAWRTEQINAWAIRDAEMFPNLIVNVTRPACCGG